MISKWRVLYLGLVNMMIVYAFLDHVNKFNMEARYPEDLKAFYKKANRD